MIGLNPRAKENISLAVRWLADNEIKFDTDLRGKHPAFVFTRLGNQRRVTFAGSPSSDARHQILRSVKNAVRELGYNTDEKIEAREEPSRAEKKAIAAAGSDKISGRGSGVFLQGVEVPFVPDVARGEGAGIAHRNHIVYKAFVQERIKFVAQVRSTSGATFDEIVDVLRKAGHHVTAPILSSQNKHGTEGLLSIAHARAAKPRGPKAAASPRVSRSITALTRTAAAIIDEIARQKLASAYAERDAIKADAESYEGLLRKAEKDERLKGLLALMG